MSCKQQQQSWQRQLLCNCSLTSPPPPLDIPSLYHHCGRQVAGGRHFRFLGLATVVISAYTCPTFGHIAAVHSLQEASGLGPHFSMTFHSWAAATPPHLLLLWAENIYGHISWQRNPSLSCCCLAVTEASRMLTTFSEMFQRNAHHIPRGLSRDRDREKEGGR